MSKLPAETDPRFPSGKWVGFFLDRRLPGRHRMEILLTFAGGRMSGEGRDRVGKFTFEGSYDLSDGRCVWAKRYVGRHAVRYTGFNEGRDNWQSLWTCAIYALFALTLWRARAVQSPK